MEKSVPYNVNFKRDNETRGAYSCPTSIRLRLRSRCFSCVILGLALWTFPVSYKYIQAIIGNNIANGLYNPIQNPVENRYLRKFMPEFWSNTQPSILKHSFLIGFFSRTSFEMIKNIIDAIEYCFKIRVSKLTLNILFSC